MTALRGCCLNYFSLQFSQCCLASLRIKGEGRKSKRNVRAEGEPAFHRTGSRGRCWEGKVGHKILGNCWRLLEFKDFHDRVEYSERKQ